MESIVYKYWEDNGSWLGYIEEYPDYWTQGKDLKDLKENLADLYKDLSNNEIPNVVRRGELKLS